MTALQEIDRATSQSAAIVRVAGSHTVVETKNAGQSIIQSQSASSGQGCQTGNPYSNVVVGVGQASYEKERELRDE